jgi:hypothetical protein
MQACRKIPWISYPVTPLVNAPRTWIFSSFGFAMAASMARLTMLRVRRSRPGRPQTSPQQYRSASS